MVAYGINERDTIKDGVEIGTVGSPRDAVYRTKPHVADSDGDGLQDDAEDRNPVDVSCDDNQQSSASSSGWGDPTPGPSFPSIVNDPLLAGLLDQGNLYEDPVGAYYAVDDNQTPYLVGAYGVSLYAVLEEGVPWDWPIPQRTTTASSSSSGPPASTDTNPTRWDTDGDGLSDGAEVYGTLNAFDARSDAARPPGNTDPRRCDSDGDGLGDGLEAGVGGWTRNRFNDCTHRDLDWGATASDPNAGDTDGDGLDDAREDANKNGRLDIVRNGYALCGSPGSESLVADVDTDDDGVRDDQELLQGLLVACFDTDQDGLSDGLETGVETPWPDTPLIGGTDTSHTVFGDLNWPTWQRFQGNHDGSGNPITTLVADADSDDDGLLDALEDLNHNGKFGDWNIVLNAYELNPSPVDGNGDGRPDGADTDGDRIVDGRELLIWGTSCRDRAPACYTFEDFIVSKQGSFIDMVYDSLNRLETDPRNPNTDAAGVDGYPDTVPDGWDILPRGDGLMQLDLGTYQSEDKIDACFGDCAYKVDLSLELQLDTPAGRFSVNTVEIPDWYTRHAKSFSALPEDQLENLLVEGTKDAPTASARKAFMKGVWGPSIVNFDLPDYMDATHGGWQPTTTFSVSVLATDADWTGFDTIDLSSTAGERRFASAPNKVYDLSKGLGDPCRMAAMDLYGNGNADGEDVNKEDDGILSMDLGNNLVPFFLQGLLDAKAGGPVTAPLNAGTSFGDRVTCPVQAAHT